MCELQCNALLPDAQSYTPDTLDLNSDMLAAKYWFPCFRQMIAKFARQAADSQRENDATAEQRAQKFEESYLSKLGEFEDKLQENAAIGKVLGTKQLLELNEIELRRFGFQDPWAKQKKAENKAAVALLERRLQEIDEIKDTNARWTELVRGVLAGNMFDWGAAAVANIIETDADFGLHKALDRIEKRPWLMDDLDAWLARLNNSEKGAHKCAVVFVDNSGVDVCLGILPFVRELLKRGTKVLLCANSEPSLNDVTCKELSQLLEESACHCAILSQALSSQRLIVYGNGQKGPCLDMRKLPVNLCNAIKSNETDLLVIEGMGRALHTNLKARFSCETLKLAVIKNKWLAQYLGGDTFAVMCKYETAQRANS